MLATTIILVAVIATAYLTRKKSINLTPNFNR